ncbi:MAG TPA: phospholipase D-like domain-containing protein [Patescibacteria group bacterium]|nr:phospholipase D-like domain-containing protein [Patescibacteria group bacterium]
MNNPLTSQLFDEKTFYHQFLKDLKRCQREVIIESPFITTKRVQMFYPVFRNLLNRGVSIFIMTRPPAEHENKVMSKQAEIEIQNFERLGIQTLLCVGNHHRKLAILDRQILWEGSLNILSQANSREIMRKLEGKETAMQMFTFLRLDQFL